MLERPKKSPEAISPTTRNELDTLRLDIEAHKDSEREALRVREKNILKKIEQGNKNAHLFEKGATKTYALESKSEDQDWITYGLKEETAVAIVIEEEDGRKHLILSRAWAGNGPFQAQEIKRQLSQFNLAKAKSVRGVILSPKFPEDEKGKAEWAIDLKKEIVSYSKGKAAIEQKTYRKPIGRELRQNFLVVHVSKDRPIQYRHETFDEFFKSKKEIEAMKTQKK